MDFGKTNYMRWGSIETDDHQIGKIFGANNDDTVPNYRTVCRIGLLRFGQSWVNRVEQVCQLGEDFYAFHVQFLCLFNWPN